MLDWHLALGETVGQAVFVRYLKVTAGLVSQLTLTPKSGPGGSSPMRPERWSYPSWPVPASGSRCSSGTVVDYNLHCPDDLVI